MNKQEAEEIFWKIYNNYNEIKSPKYLNANLKELKVWNDTLMSIKEHFKNHFTFEQFTSNSLPRIIAKMNRKSTWTNISERGVNKSVIPIKKSAELPTEWTHKWGETCSVSRGYWGAKNYILMDVLGSMLLLKEGGGQLPKKSESIFSDLKDVKLREEEFNDDPVQAIVSRKYYVEFSDVDFREYSGLHDMSSDDIFKLIGDTSGVEFKLSFPCRLGNHKGRETIYATNWYTRFFEYGEKFKNVKKDGTIHSRRYMVVFNTILGELFINNLKTWNVSKIENSFYQLPNSAQIFYRVFLLHNDYTPYFVNLNTIAKRVGLEDSNITSLKTTIKSNILEPLKQYGLIKSYQKSDMSDKASGVQYTIYR